MLFQLTPYCEHEEEIESFPKHPKFLVVTDNTLNTFFLIRSKAFTKINKMNLSVLGFLDEFATSRDIHVKVTQLFAKEGDDTC